MPTDINTLKLRYFVGAADVSPTETVPTVYDSSQVTPILDAADYNAELEKALAPLGTGPDPARDFILIANWWLGLLGGRVIPADLSGYILSKGPTAEGENPYFLDGPPNPGPPPTGGTKRLIDVLINKAKLGVDVRVLGWVSFGVMGTIAQLFPNAFSFVGINSQTLRALKTLRAEPTIGPKAAMNVIAHTAGGAHTKLVVIGNATEAVGFTGGLDFVSDRWAHRTHPDGEYWHDVMAKVTGSAVQGLYDWFRDMWTENISRDPRIFRFDGDAMPSVMPRTPLLPARVLFSAGSGSHSVQSLRTVPKFNYRWYNILPENRQISFAPQGKFDTRTAWRKAIVNAETYIYMEDQSFWSREVLEFVNTAIKSHPGLRVILLAGGKTDPNDPAFPGGYLSNSINHGLLEGLSVAQQDQVRMFRRMTIAPVLTQTDGVVAPVTITITDVIDHGTTSTVTTNITFTEDIALDQMAGLKWALQIGGNLFRIKGNPVLAKNSPVQLIAENIIGPVILKPSTGTFALLHRDGIFVHTKTTLVDDKWSIIGSANCMRRSLYTDLEYGISFIDPAEVVVKDYRKRLWADTFRHDKPEDFDLIQSALHAWEPTWGVVGAAPNLPDLIEPIKIPVPESTMSKTDQSRYSTYDDVDSRDPWGGLCP